MILGFQSMKKTVDLYMSRTCPERFRFRKLGSGVGNCILIKLPEVILRFVKD